MDVGDCWRSLLRGAWDMHSYINRTAGSGAPYTINLSQLLHCIIPPFSAARFLPKAGTKAVTKPLPSQLRLKGMSSPMAWE